MGMKVMEFGIKLMTIPSGSTINVKPTVDEQTLGVEALKSEIGKIEKEVLKEIMIKIRATKAEWESKSPLERKALEKEIFKTCFNAVGVEGLKNIMRSNLTSLIQGSIPADIQLAINLTADRFKEICINQIQ
jgi:hypothetical protein